MKVFATELPRRMQERIIEAAKEVLPLVLPVGWHCPEDIHWNARWYFSDDGLRVCLEIECQDLMREIETLELWLHLSVSRANRDPTYADLKRVKDAFIGGKRKAIQVFPSDAEHYNHHPHCLHLYAPLDRDPLPDFRHHTGAL